MIGSNVLGVLVFLLLNTVLRLFKKGKQQAFEISAIFGFALVIINYGTIKLPAWLGVLLIIPVIFGMVYLFRFWKEEGDTLKEALLFLLVNLILCVTLNNAAVRMHDLTSVKWVTAVFDTISSIAFIVLVGFVIADMIKFRREMGDEYYQCEDEKEGKGDENDDRKKKRFWKNFAANFWY